MKKIVSFVLAAGMLLGTITASAAEFFDLPQEHWAYAAVQYVASKGVINGYEDGSFRPSNVVTRAEFVKMIGEGQVVRETPFKDVDESHWGYKYIMSSGMEVKGDLFLPEQPILRGEVIDLLWTRNGSPENAEASCAITGQWDNRKAVAWAYSTGLMIGDDGVNLRLQDTLTRAEAATLIQRSEGLTAGLNRLRAQVSDQTLLLVLNGSGLLDAPQSELTAPVSNLELAKAVMRYEKGEFNPVATTYPAGAVETMDGKRWAYVANEYLGCSEYSEEKMQAQANLSDAVAGLTGAAMRAAKQDQKFIRSKTGYDGVTAEGSKDLFLKVAKGTGVEFVGEQPLTVGEMAYVLFQLDRYVGTKVSYLNSVPLNEAVEMHADEYPANIAEYPVILETVPKSVYEAPFTVAGESDYDFAREYHTIFHGALTRFAQSVSTKTCKIQFTYYPSLVKHCGDDRYVMRVKMTVDGDLEQKTLGDIFREQYDGEDMQLGEMYLDIYTVERLTTNVYPEENLKIINVIK